MLKKIVVIGPESTGKSSLCNLLAKHFNCFWCEEYARAYLLQNGTNYSFENLATIAKGQLLLEDEYTKLATQANQDFLIFDTDMYVMKVWCQFVFNKMHTFIEEEILIRKYDLYLLCDTDIPWVKDELREYPDLDTRQKLFDIYHHILKNQTTPFVIINGNYEERLQKAILSIEKIAYKNTKG